MISLPMGDRFRKPITSRDACPSGRGAPYSSLTSLTL
jgi:hypothetical protein